MAFFIAKKKWLAWQNEKELSMNGYFIDFKHLQAKKIVIEDIADIDLSF